MKNIIVKIEDEEGNLIAKLPYRSWEKRFLQAKTTTDFVPSDTDAHAAFGRNIASRLELILYRNLVWGPYHDQDELHHPCIPSDSEL